MVEVWRTPLTRRFVADFCSCGFWVAVLFWTTVVVVPFFLAFTSQSFWMRTGTYYEYPEVEFTYKMLMHAGGYDGADVPQVITYATPPELHPIAATKGGLRIPSLSTYIEDANRDEVAEVIHVEAEVPLRQGETLHSINALFMFQLKLKDRAKLVMENAVYVDYSPPLPGSSLYYDCDLRLMQRNPLSVRGGYPNVPLYQDDTLLSNSTYSPGTSADLTMSKLLRRYRDRNISTSIDHVYSAWTPSAGSRTASTTQEPFRLHLAVRVPQQGILYRPGLSEMLKFAWIQYLALAFIVYVLGTYSADFVYNFQVVETTSRLDTQYYGPKIHRF